MAKKLNYTSETILNIRFNPNSKGYEPLEVDETLDKVIEDYEVFNNNLKEADDLNNKHLQEIKELKEEIKKLELEYARLKKHYEAAPKSSINDDNYTLLKKVNAYERVLHRKGIDLKKALSDPDNC